MSRPESLARQWRDLQAHQRREDDAAVREKKRELTASAAPILAELRNSKLSTAQKRYFRGRITLTIQRKLRDYGDELTQHRRQQAQEKTQKLRAPDVEVPSFASATVRDLVERLLSTDGWDVVMEDAAGRRRVRYFAEHGTDKERAALASALVGRRKGPPKRHTEEGRRRRAWKARKHELQRIVTGIRRRLKRRTSKSGPSLLVKKGGVPVRRPSAPMIDKQAYSLALEHELCDPADSLICNVWKC